MTSLQAIAKAMHGEVSGGRACFPTPGHSAKDRGSWASLAPGAPDGVLIHSQNGGDPLAIKDELRAKGVLPNRVQSTDRDRETGCYEFCDENGSVLYRTRRIERVGKAKRFVAERLTAGKWSTTMGDVRRVPYRLPEMLAAPDATIYLVEGERKADKLAGWGMVATAIAFGSNGWVDRHDYAEYFRNRTVVILPDNDDPGREFAAKVAASINRVGKASTLELSGLPQKGDIIDWSGSADELLALTTAALNPPVDMLATIDPAAWATQETPSREWSLHEWIPARQATYLTGPGSAGKSLISQQLCTCIAAGIPFMGIETKQSVAIYVTCEDDPDELHRRQKAICASLGVSLQSLSGKLLLVSLAGEIDNGLASFDNDGRMTIGAGYRRLAATVEAHKAGFIALDNVAHLFAGNENIRNQVAAFCGLLNKLGQDADASVLFLGHPNKAGSEFSGSTAWENQVRSRLFIETPKEDDGTVPDRDSRILSRGKANYARNGEGVTFRWHEWAFVRDSDLSPGIAEELAASAANSEANSRFLKCLAAVTARGEATSHIKGTNYAPRKFVSMAEAQGMKETQFAKAMERLLHLDHIRLNQALWRDANRHWKQGLKLTSECADPPAATPCVDLRAPPTQAIENTAATLRAATPLYINISGGPSEAPFHEEKKDTRSWDELAHGDDD